MQVINKLRKAIKYISKPFRFSPLTLRGWLVLIFSLLGLFYIAIPKSDLVSFILSGSALFLLFVSLTFSFIGKYLVKRSISVNSYYKSKEAYSKTNVASVINLKNLRLLPLLSLSVRKIFKHKPAVSSTHTLSGSFKKSPEILIEDTTKFPHRGFWQTEFCDFNISDRFGLTSLKWKTPLPSALEVNPLEKQIEPVPTTASSWTSGEQISQTKERLGEPFDIKPYHPSDGTKRILWKAYARRGELVVRQPEPSVLPNGEVLIYLVASQKDDFTAGCLVNYLKQLQDAEIEVIFGTDGSFDAISSDKTFENIFRQINYSVWSKEAGSGNGLQSFLKNPHLSKKNFREVVVFTDSKIKQETLNKMSKVASANNITAKFCLTPATSSNSKSLVKQNQVFSVLTNILSKNKLTKKLVKSFSSNPEDSISFGKAVHYLKIRKA